MNLSAWFDRGVACALFAIPLARQRGFDALLFARFQIERVALHFFDDVFLKDLPLEAPQRTVERFALMDMDFCQFSTHLPFVFKTRPFS